MTRGSAARRTVWLLLAMGGGQFGAVDPLEGQPFQGRIRMQLRTTGPSGPALQAAEYSVQGNKARLDLPEVMGGVAMLVTAGSRQMTMLMVAQQRFAESAMPGGPDALAPAMPAPRITRSGRMETMAGLRCEHVTVAAEGQVADLCLTTALGPLVMNPLEVMGRASGTSAWPRALGADEFPLRVTLPDGTVGLQVTAVERKRLAPDLFAVPLEYTRMEPPRRF